MENINCLCCNSNSHDLLYEKGQFNLKLNLVACKDCGFTFLNPRKSKEEYMEFYANEYDKYYRPAIINLNNKSEQNKLGEVLIKRFGSRFKDNQNVLEIGSGEGFNLISIKNKFPNSKLFAIEPSTVSSEILKRNDINVISNDADSNWEETSPKFDVIIMRHVLEHMINPIELLKKIKNALSETGILYIAVPNSYKPKSPLKDWIRVPHTFYFSKDSLNIILNKSGLKTIGEITEGDIDNQFELYCFTTKSEQTIKSKINNNYAKQIDIFNQISKHENNLIFKLKSKAIKLKSKIFS
jgi:SAM-dependent methyltransferase